ncbi:MAG TPA: glycosyltransferase family 39 protein [Verrucomicrobiae bacterium]|nr:glycosyltransferase family 39 protein [Verrucomicrobiae bacterium]
MNPRPPDTSSSTQLTRRDGIIAILMFLVALASRIPFRSQFAYHWDSAQFALAIGDYNLRISQPHAPGFYLYVWLGRLMSRLVGEPHAALVWLSVLAGAGLVAIGYLLATSMFGHACGVGTGLILLTSPLCWFHSEIALTTIVDSALVVSFVFVCWRAISNGLTWGRTFMLAALFAAVAGVRLQSAPILIPLSVYVFCYSLGTRWQKRVGGAVVAFGLCLFWFVPTLKSAGGLLGYVELLRLKSQFDAVKTVWGGGGVGALIDNVSGMAHACWSGLLAAGLVAAVALASWVFRKSRTEKEQLYGRYQSQLVVLSLWIIPAMMFWVFMYVTMPGYVLNLFPALVILASLGVIGFSELLMVQSPGRGARWLSPVVWGTLLAVNVTAFVFSPTWMAGLWLGVPLSRVQIRQHDKELSACFETIRQKWPSQGVVICHHWEDFYWGFRQFEYYLPQYQNVLLSSDKSLPGLSGTESWVGYRHQTSFVKQVTVSKSEDIVIVVPPGESIDGFRKYLTFHDAKLILGGRVELYCLEH